MSESSFPNSFFCFPFVNQGCKSDIPIVFRKTKYPTTLALGEVPKIMRKIEFFFKIGSIFFGLNFAKRRDGHLEGKCREFDRKENEGILLYGIAAIGKRIYAERDYKNWTSSVAKNSNYRKFPSIAFNPRFT